MERGKKKKRFLGWYFDTPLVARVLTALVLGALAGLLIGPDIKAVEPLGALMLKLLQMVVLPLIFFAIVVGMGSTPASKIGRIAGKVILCYVLTTMLAASLALGLGYIIEPGSNANLSVVDDETAEAMEAGTEIIEDTEIENPKFSDIILNMVPDNVVKAFAEGSYLQVLTFAVFFGLSISILKDSKDEKILDKVNLVYEICEGGSEIMFNITQGVLEYTPIGVFALISVVFAEEGLSVIGSLGELILACYIGYAFQIFIVYGLMLKGSGIDPIQFARKSKDITLMAFATRSSNAVLPLSMTTAEEEIGISKTVSGFALPLGSQVNMNGEAYYQILSILFIANAIGLKLTFADQLMMVLLVTLGSIGTAGIAGAGPVVLLAILESVGIDMAAGTPAAAAFALVLGIDVILDMGRSAANVTGDVVSAAVVAKSEDLFDEEIFYSKTGKEKVKQEI